MYYLFRGEDDKKNGGTGLKVLTGTPTYVFAHGDWPGYLIVNEMLGAET